MSGIPSGATTQPASTPMGNQEEHDLRATKSLLLLECLAVFVLGFSLMHYFYAASTAKPGDPIGAPEYDSFYHIAMASMLPEYGLLPTFPWLQYVYWRNEGDAFVSHHVGFHAFLLPFVSIAQWLTGDALNGGRWAMSCTLGVNLVLFYLLLRAGRVPWRWVWVGLFVLLPEQFFSRHGFVRAIGPSFALMQLTLLLLFQRRYAWAGVSLFLYVQLYLGAVLYGPVLVAIYALSRLIGPAGDRDVPWKPVLITAAAWGVAVLAYPYRSGMFEFLWMQVFQTGLTPTVEVGREWLPYTDPWFLLQMAAPLLVTWVVALTLRLRFGPRLDARETTLLLLQFFFLVLTCKARRFIEYWPPLCLLSAAWLAAPVLRRVRTWFESHWRTVPGLGIAVLLILAADVALLLGILSRRPDVQRIFGEWQLWSFLAALLMLAPLARVWADGFSRGATSIVVRIALMLGAGGALVAAAGLIVRFGIDPGKLPPPRIEIPIWLWGGLAVLYVVAAFTAGFPQKNRPDAAAYRDRWSRSLAILLLAMLLPTGALALAAPRFPAITSALRCNFDLEEIRRIADFLRRHSQPGDIVFTDDWDVFPVQFYHNRLNYYCVGLDPEFTNRRRPDLWQRYVKITRAETPATVTIPSRAPEQPPQVITVRQSDIREHFRARWVITDRDHRALAQSLANDPQLAELVYPCSDYEKCASAPYLIFRIRGENEPLPADVLPQPDAQGRLPLSRMRPKLVQQGYGELRANRTVDNNEIRMRGRRFSEGLGTHAPSVLVYEIPPGAVWFEAVVGVDDETNGKGSVVVSVQLDGNTVYESLVLSGVNEPVVLKLPLGNARQITLGVDPTDDGRQFDHVNWADARFLFRSTDSNATTRPNDLPQPPGKL